MALALLLAPEGAWGQAPGGDGYEDVADAAGIVFRLAGEVHGDDGWPAFPEIMGSGACWFDADGDGYDDLYLVNQRYNPDNPWVDPAWAEAADPHNQLHLNDGDGTFTDRSAASGADSRAWGYGCSAADHDGDGDVDLFVANLGDNELFRNDGDGVFTEVGAEAGVAMPGACGEFDCMSTSSAWADYDLDGDLDLYVGNYVDTTTLDLDRAPSLHVAQPNWLFRNEGDGTFTEVGATTGTAGHATDADGSKTLGVVWLDHDLDGWPDLYVCNDTTANHLFVNQRDGTFEDRAAEAGVADTRAGMGCVAGDYDRDGLADLYMTHYAFELNGFYRNRGDGTFEDRSGEDDLLNEWPYVGWGVAWVDADRDADLDLLMVNGGTDWDIGDYGQGALLFLQDPPLQGADPWDAEWVDQTPHAGPGINEARVSRGAAFADHDLDGDTDLAVVANANQTARLLAAPASGNGWLTLELRQPGANPQGVGARVALEAGGRVQWREVRAGSGYLGQDTARLEFGLGAAAHADALTVHWPDGGPATRIAGPLASGQVLRVDRATGAVGNDTLAPRTVALVTGPGTGTSGGGADGWWSGPVEVVLEARDRGVTWTSGVAATEAAVGNGEWMADPGDARAFAEEGVHLLHHRSRDGAGNQEPRRTTAIGIDATPPALPGAALDGIAGANGWWAGEAVTVTLEADDRRSGVASFRHRVDGGPWEEVRGPFPVRGDGVHVVEAFAVDRAGNEGPTLALEVRIDATPPEVALLRPREGTAYLGAEEVAALPGGVAQAVVVGAPRALGLGGLAFPVEASAADGASGVDRVLFRLDGEVVAVDRAAPFAWTWDLASAAPGLHEVEALAVDVAGNLAGHEVEVVLLASPADAPWPAQPGLATDPSSPP